MTATYLYHSWSEQLGHIRVGQNRARLRTFAWMMVGMLLSGSLHLSHIAGKIPSAGQQTSIIKRLSRLLQNGALRVREWYQPVARELLQAVVASGGAVRLLIDGTKIGGGDRLLMVAVAYRRRMWIEEMFADCKQHRFDLESTHLRHFLRLSRLTLLVALLYLWCVACGTIMMKRGLRYLVDRSDRRDLSLFRLALDMIERLLTNGKSLSIWLLPLFEKVYRS
jgi:hypothetical protein